MPPVRRDPFRRIVSVGWGKIQYAIVTLKVDDVGTWEPLENCQSAPGENLDPVPPLGPNEGVTDTWLLTNTYELHEAPTSAAITLFRVKARELQSASDDRPKSASGAPTFPSFSNARWADRPDQSPNTDPPAPGDRYSDDKLDPVAFFAAGALLRYGGITATSGDICGFSSPGDPPPSDPDHVTNGLIYRSYGPLPVGTYTGLLDVSGVSVAAAGATFSCVGWRWNLVTGDPGYNYTLQCLCKRNED